MRILLVTHLFPPDGIAGVERYTQRLAAELVRRGDTVSIVTRREDATRPTPRLLRERLPDGTPLYRFAGGERTLERPLAHQEELEQLFARVLLEAVPDVVHFNHLFGLAPRSLELAQRYGAAVVLTLHDYYFACPLVQ